MPEHEKRAENPWTSLVHCPKNAIEIMHEARGNSQHDDLFQIIAHLRKPRNEKENSNWNPHKHHGSRGEKIGHIHGKHCLPCYFKAKAEKVSCCCAQ